MNATTENIELEQIHATISKLIAESQKLNAETEKFREETKKIAAERVWYPFVAGAGTFAALLAALIGIAKIFA